MFFFSSRCEYLLDCATPNGVVVVVVVGNSFSGFGATSGAGSGNNSPSLEPNDGIIEVEISKSKFPCPGFDGLVPSLDLFTNLLPIGGRSW